MASVSDRDNLIAEIWLDNKLVYELNTENDKLAVVFHNEKEATYDYENFIKTLQNAKERLELLL